MSGYAILQEYMFTDKDKHEWTDAMCYLLEKYAEFPSDMDINIQPEPEHKDFRFIKTLEGKILFGNCIVPAITADDFYQFKAIN